MQEDCEWWMKHLPVFLGALWKHLATWLPSKRGPLSRDDIYNHTDHQGNLQEASRLSLNVLLFSFGLPVCNTHPIYIWALSSKNHPSAVSCIFSVWPKIAIHVSTGWLSLLYIFG